MTWIWGWQTKQNLMSSPQDSTLLPRSPIFPPVPLKRWGDFRKDSMEVTGDVTKLKGGLKRSRGSTTSVILPVPVFEQPSFALTCAATFITY